MATSEHTLFLTDDEVEALERGPTPPFLVTDHWKSLLDGSPDDPLRRQVVPSLAEFNRSSDNRDDPLGEGEHSPLPRLIRRYRDRALVVVTGACALYCRHCFRRRLTGDDYGAIGQEDLDKIAAYLGDHEEIREVLLSGGDPLTVGAPSLFKIIDVLRKARPDIVLRLATRIPLVDPRRITVELAEGLGTRRPIWVVIQCNHPRELVPRSLESLDRLQRQGLPVINQAVLLRGVNDHPDILEELSRRLVAASVKPYYLFQGDLAVGTDHFRLPLDTARSLVRELRKRLSGLAMPGFAVDLPGGGGKVPLGDNHVLGRESGGWLLESPDGVRGLYPDPQEIE